MASGCDYSPTPAQADLIAGVSNMPADIREMIFARYARDHGVQALVELAAQIVGMANSVIANNRECIELFGICEGTLHPHNARQINLPTLFGAAVGAKLALRAAGCKRMCHGCAYRLGTPANQSPVTTCDADYAREEADHMDFLCHEAPQKKRRCRGHAKALRHAR